MAADWRPEKHGAYLVIPFFRSDLTTGDSNVDLTCNVAGPTTYCAPRPGSIVAVSATCNAISAGTVTVTPHKTSTEYAEVGTPIATLDSDHDTNGGYSNADHERGVRFAAGDVLGLSVTTTTTLSPTNTIDISAFLHIVLDPT